MTRNISILNVVPVHPHRGEPSRIEITIDLGLKSGEVASEVLTGDKALKLAEQLVHAVRVTGALR